MLSPYINAHIAPHQIGGRTESRFDKDIYLWIDPSLDPEKDIDLVCLSNGLDIINHDGKMPDSSQQITKGDTHQQVTATVRQKIKVGKVQKGISNKQYISNAVVPRMSWQPIVHFDFSNNLLVGEGCPSYYNTVAIVKLSTRIEDFMSSVNFSEINVNSSLNHDFINEIVSSISVEVEKLNTCDYQVFNSIAINKPGLHTVTFDHKQSKYLGLHIDSFDKDHPWKRRFSSNRICINLSTEDRYFVFINKTILSIVKEIQQLQPELILKETHLDISKLAYYFAICKPHYPVVRVKCPPGYAYIAPTENIIHDGSSENQTQLDVSISFRGFFSPNPSQVINDSQYGDWDLLALYSLFTKEECQKIVSEVLDNQQYWQEEICSRLQQFFRDLNSNLTIRLNDNLQLNRVNRNSFQLQYGSSLPGFGRHTLILFLNDGFSGGETYISSASYKITPKRGDGVIFSKFHHYEDLSVYQGEKILLKAEIMLDYLP
jgi:hypothetical protein